MTQSLETNVLPSFGIERYLLLEVRAPDIASSFVCGFGFRSDSLKFRLLDTVHTLIHSSNSSAPFLTTIVTMPCTRKRSSKTMG